MPLGRPELCRRMDFLRLMSGHSISGRSTNDELRQISDTEAPARGCDNPLPPPPPPGAASPPPPPGPERPQTAARQSMHGLATINALISPFLFCPNDRRVPGESPVTFCKYCWRISLHLPLLSLTLLSRAQIQIFWTWLACQVRREPTARQVVPAENTGETRGEEMSCDKDRSVSGTCCLWLIRLLFSVMPKTAEIHSVSSICLLPTVYPLICICS